MMTVVVRTKGPSSRTLRSGSTYIPLMLTSTTASLLRHPKRHSGHQPSRSRRGTLPKARAAATVNPSFSLYIASIAVAYAKSLNISNLLWPFIDFQVFYPAFVYVNENNEARQPEKRRNLIRNDQRRTFETEMQDDRCNGPRHQKCNRKNTRFLVPCLLRCKLLMVDIHE